MEKELGFVEGYNACIRDVNHVLNKALSGRRDAESVLSATDQMISFVHRKGALGLTGDALFQHQ